MKKLMQLMFLMIGIVVLSASGAHASVPLISGTLGDGALGAGEWLNDSDSGAGVTAYPYYLEVFDINEFNADPTLNIPDAYDIKRVVLLQELDSFSGDGDATNDGIYLLIETYAPHSLVDLTPGGQLAGIFLDGDFDGNGSIDFSLKHSADGSGGSQSVDVTFNIFGPPFSGNLVAFGGAFSLAGNGSTFLEYFIPSSGFNTPASQFPSTFIGQVNYDNGAINPDDIVVGTLIPEPSTMMLLGLSLLGMAGSQFKK